MTSWKNVPVHFPRGLRSGGVGYFIHLDGKRGDAIVADGVYLKRDGTIGRNFGEFDRRFSWSREHLTLRDAAVLVDLTSAEFKKEMGTTHGWFGESLTGVILR